MSGCIGWGLGWLSEQWVGRFELVVQLSIICSTVLQDWFLAVMSVWW